MLGLLLVALMIGQQAISGGGNDTDVYYSGVDVMPEFPGGHAAMAAYITKNLRYPDVAREAGIEGKVFVRFVVTKTGDVADVEVSKGINSSCDAEAVRVVKAMPKWVPGKQNGQNVNVMFTLPIAFKLVDKNKDK